MSLPAVGLTELYSWYVSTSEASRNRLSICAFPCTGMTGRNELQNFASVSNSTSGFL